MELETDSYSRDPNLSMNLQEHPALDSDAGWRWCNWVPTSMAALRDAELKLLSYLRVPTKSWFANIGHQFGKEDNLIRTVSANDTSQSTPLVLVHGFGAGVALWILNLESLSRKRPVYAFDILGFGRSSRPTFSSHSEEAEAQLVESFERWRESIGLKEFVLLGHSMGGFLASSYALKHPQHVKHLVLADPWGFQERKPDSGKNFPIWAKIVIRLVQPFNPLAVLRAAGPWGPGLIERFRPDIKAKFSPVVKDEQDVISSYIYHCNAQTPSGETAFKSMTSQIGWAKHPMANRILALKNDVPMSFIFGSESWVDKAPGYEIQNKREDSHVAVYVVKGAGHHVYADEPEAFNKLVDYICQEEDTKSDIDQPVYRRV
ncbi:hypothetical protein CHUAL_006789 [Chamberlinius hualienensis]